MKRRRTAMLIAGLLASMLLLEPVSAQYHAVPGNPAPLPPGTIVPAPMPAPGGSAATITVPPLPPGMPVAPCATCAAAATPAPAPAAGQKTCTGKTETVKTSTPAYSSKDTEYCYPRCSCHDSATCDNCTGCVRTKTALVKKMVTTEKQVCKCTVGSPEGAAVSPCSTGGCGAPASAPCASGGCGAGAVLPSTSVPASPYGHGSVLPGSPVIVPGSPMPVTPSYAPPSGNPVPLPMPESNPLPRGARAPLTDNLMPTSGTFLPPIR
jgi:hypothetical protein